MSPSIRPFAWISGAFIAGVLLLCLSVMTTTLRIYATFSAEPAYPIECALVFGAAVHGTDRAGPGITRRTETAVALWEEGSVERLIFTGGVGEGGVVSEAQVMKQLAVEGGVPAEKILLEERSTSTWENLLYARPLVDDCESLVAISDRYHLYRIQILAALHKWPPFAVQPADRAASRAFEIRSIVREVLGIHYYGLFQPDNLLYTLFIQKMIEM